jgi:ribonuclease J
MINNTNGPTSRPSRPRGSFSRNRNAYSTPDKHRSNAVAVEKPKFIVKKEYDEGYPTTKKTKAPKVSSAMYQTGNLSNPHIFPHLFRGPELQSNSPTTFPDGPVVRIMPIGGASEVGMNLTAIECGDDIIVIDTGFGFGGGDKYPGVDNILPDVSYLEQNKHKIKGLVYTHAHLDHIGGAPFIIPKLGMNVPIFGTPLTLALLKNRLSEFSMEEKLSAKVIDPSKTIKLGCFEIDFFRLNHSLPDCVGLYIRTPMGNIVYATDWKFDNTPYDGVLSDYDKLARIGTEGVRLLLTDSLGILKPGYQISERAIGDTLVKIIGNCQERVVVTAFATTVSRIQFTVDAAVKHNRKIVLLGRSMIKNFKTCYDMGYLKVPAGMIIELEDSLHLPANQVIILMTGSQAEDKAALARVARNEHDKIKLGVGDSVIFSSGPIPGNESDIQDLIALLSRSGVDVYRNKDFDLHVSGHACHEDIKLLLALCKPSYLLPIHGDHWMLKRVGELGASMGIPTEHCLIAENGRVIEMNPQDTVVTNEKIVTSVILVDGTSVGAVSEVVLDERRQLATEGAIVVIVMISKSRKILDKPGIISRGFIYMKNNTDMMEEIRTLTYKHLSTMTIDTNSEMFFVNYRNTIKDVVADLVFQKTEKQPMIIPVVVQV